MDREQRNYRRWCDDARTYENMLPSEKTALQSWIRLAVMPSELVRAERSYDIKHDFARDGFFVTAAQFRGALVIAGYAPATKTDRFRLAPRSCNTFRNGTYAGFSLRHLRAAERAGYDRQVRMAVVEREQWRDGTGNGTLGL
jgi:hypothetical protein